jgi:hypothetical protein
MRYRKLDNAGDMTFGHAQQDFWINQPEGVAQWIMTRLRLNQGEWFVDTTDGTPWATQVLGERTQSTRDVVVRDRVNTTPNVTAMLAYQSQMDVNARAWTATMTVQTAYGAVVLQAQRLPGAPPLLPGGYTAPARRSQMLGITGVPGFDIAATAAPLQGVQATNITDFTIASRDAGEYR